MEVTWTRLPVSKYSAVESTKHSRNKMLDGLEDLLLGGVRTKSPVELGLDNVCSCVDCDASFLWREWEN